MKGEATGNVKNHLGNAPQFHVWSRLRSLRQSQNLTQIQVSAGSGVPIITLSFLESGYIEPTATVKTKLYKFYKADPDDFFPTMMVGDKPCQPKGLALRPPRPQPNILHDLLFVKEKRFSLFLELLSASAAC
jgi:transcriptional regulator with XRE-family HTH domain